MGKYNYPKSSSEEKINREKLYHLFKNNPIGDIEIMNNLTLFLRKNIFHEILSMNCLYRKILDIPGIVIELGCRWGQRLSTFTSLRGIYEPYNFKRKIVGFDTFSGFKEINKEDIGCRKLDIRNFSTTEDYDIFLNDLLGVLENESPLSHIKKYDIIKGDVIETLPLYLKENTSTIVGLVYFDLDLYKPTLECLKTLLPYMHQETIIAFDEFAHPTYPGETSAFKEFANISNSKLMQIENTTYPTYIKLKHLDLR